MSDQSRALLDELFGKDRNIPANQRRNEDHYYYDDVCKNQLVSMCFNELWKHTKYDHDGECKKRHDKIFHQEFLADRSLKKLQREKGYIEDAIGTLNDSNYFLLQLIAAYIENKTKGVERICLKHQQQLETKANLQIERPKDIQDRLDKMEVQMKLLLSQSEQLGEQGKLEESEKLAQEAENVKKSREEYLLVCDSQNNPYKTFKICEICGARQSLNETDTKMKSHLEGKIHQGFSIIRQEYNKLTQRKNQVEKLIEEEQNRKESDKRDKSEHRHSHSKHESKAKSRSKSKQKTKQKKSKDKKKRSHKKSRSRSRSRQ